MFFFKWKVFWWNEAVEVIEATEVVEAVEVIEAIELYIKKFKPYVLIIQFYFHFAVQKHWR